tara:strand:- start:356 stop:583 length:228 start_codon:yes stop_codon:yes gene_type:complete
MQTLKINDKGHQFPPQIIVHVVWLHARFNLSLRVAQILIERWRRHYNTLRPHSALGYRPPAPKSIVPIDQRPTMH